MTKTIETIEKELQKHSCIKINLELFGLYLNPNDGNHNIKSFNTPFKIICNNSDIKTNLDEMNQIVDRKADEFAEKDSGNLCNIYVYTNK